MQIDKRPPGKEKKKKKPSQEKSQEDQWFRSPKGFVLVSPLHVVILSIACKCSLPPIQSSRKFVQRYVIAV